jgi:hypothetical protein
LDKIESPMPQPCGFGIGKVGSWVLFCFGVWPEPAAKEGNSVRAERR